MLLMNPVVRISGEGLEEAGELPEEGRRDPLLEDASLAGRCRILRVSAGASAGAAV